MERTSGEGYAMRGVSLARLGRVKEADFFITHKTVQGTNNPQVRRIVAEYYAATRNFDDAEKTFREGLARDKNNKYLILGLIDLYTSQKRHREIVGLCENALQIDPSDKEIVLRKADSLFALGRIPEAIKAYEQYLTMAPENTNVLKCLARCQIKLRKNSDAQRSVNTLLEKGVKDSEVLRLKAYLLLIQGNVQEAIDYLNTVLKTEPKDVWTLRIKGDAHLSLKEYLPALTCINQVLEIEPQNILMHEKKGKIFLLLGFFQDAATSFKAAIDRGRRSAEIFAQYGDAIRHGGFSRYGSATDCVSQPGNQNAKWRASQLYLDIWDTHDITPKEIEALAQATDWYDRSLAEGGEESLIWNRKGIVATLLGDFGEAKILFEQAVQSNEKEPAFLTNLSVMHILKGDIDQGITLLLQGMSRFPKRPYFLDQCAGMYFIHKKDHKAALDLSRQAISVNTNRDPCIPYHTFLILRGMGYTDEAEKMIEVVHSLDPWFNISDDSSEDMHQR
jgi:tetratricopeptide (TPR) repeat protein